MSHGNASGHGPAGGGYRRPPPDLSVGPTPRRVSEEWGFRWSRTPGVNFWCLCFSLELRNRSETLFGDKDVSLLFRGNPTLTYLCHGNTRTLSPGGVRKRRSPLNRVRRPKSYLWGTKYSEGLRREVSA